MPEELKAEDDIVVQYRIRCSSPISAFSVAFNRDVNGIEAEYPVTRYGRQRRDARSVVQLRRRDTGPRRELRRHLQGWLQHHPRPCGAAALDKEIKNGTPFCKLGLQATLSTFTTQFDRDQYTNKLKTTKTVDGTTPVVINFAAAPTGSARRPAVVARRQRLQEALARHHNP